MNVIHRLSPRLGALIVAGAPLSLTPTARAQDCQSGADCAAGYRCHLQSYESCSVFDTCTADGVCSQTEPECVTTEYGSCTYAACASDGDCPGTMACRPQTSWACDGVVGGASGGVGSGGLGGCEVVPVESLCIPRYTLPCSVASDCGGGFDCVLESYSVCEGGGGVGGGGTGIGGFGGGGIGSGGLGGGTGDCNLVLVEQGSCQLQDLPCDDASECPSGMQCIEQLVWPPCAGSSAGAGGWWAGGHGGAPAPVESCPDPELQRTCMPPEWSGGFYPPLGGTGGSISGGGGASGASGGTGGDTSAGGGSSALPMSEGAGRAGSGSATGGAGGSAANGDDAGTPSWGSGEHGRDDDDGGRGSSKHCAASGPIGDDPATWLLLCSTALVLRRRARR